MGCTNKKFFEYKHGKVQYKDKGATLNEKTRSLLTRNQRESLLQNIGIIGLILCSLLLVLFLFHLPKEVFSSSYYNTVTLEQLQAIEHEENALLNDYFNSNTTILYVKKNLSILYTQKRFLKNNRKYNNPEVSQLVEASLQKTAFILEALNVYDLASIRLLLEK